MSHRKEPMTLSRRRFLKGAVAGGGACAAGPMLPRLAFAQGARKAGGALRMSVNISLTTINPVIHLSNPEFIATKWMYNNLTKLNHKREVVPDLAESWEARDSARIWIFKLRRGAKFHIGREVTAEDVVATFQTVLDPKNASPYRAELGPIDKVEAVDKYTTQFTLRAPFADLPSTLTVVAGRIIAREGLADIKQLSSKEFGSGPFQLKEFMPGDRLVVDRFPDYFKKGLPYLDRASIKVYPEATTETNALKRKEIDMVWEVTPELFTQVATTQGVDALSLAGGTFPAVVLPCEKPPFADNRVREALKYTVDRNLMLAAVYGRYGEIANDHPISTAYPVYTALPGRGQDISKAKALLREAGYPNGFSFKLYAAVSPPMREKLAVVLKEMAAPAGINIDVEVISYDRFLAQIWNKAVPYVVYYTTRPTADAILMKLYHPKEGLDEGRWAGSHPEAVKLLERARETLDLETRKKLYAEVEKISRDQGAFLIPFFRNELSAKWEYVKDYHLNPSNYDVDIEEVWLSSDAPTKKA